MDYYERQVSCFGSLRQNKRGHTVSVAFKYTSYSDEPLLCILPNKVWMQCNKELIEMYNILKYVEMQSCMPFALMK